MAGKSNTSATYFAQKKLLGKAHTSNLKVDGEELLGSNIQAGSSLIFGQDLPSSPERTLWLLQSASNGADPTVEYVHFTLEALTGTTYDANVSGGGEGSDSGEGSQSSGVHAYKLVLPTNYQTTSSNSRAGNGTFNNSRLVHETLGSMQLVPPFFSQASPNPYIVKLYKSGTGHAGTGAEIPLLDNIDWNIDYYNGILFLQDYDSNKIPGYARGFAYVGKMADEVIASGSGGSANSLDDAYDGGSTGAGATIVVDDQPVQLRVEGASSTALAVTGSVLFGSSSSAYSNHLPPLPGTNVSFYVSGSQSQGSSASNSGVSVFGGDIVVSGTLFGEGINGGAITGSITKTKDGNVYLKPAYQSNLTISTGSNGQITLDTTGTLKELAVSGTQIASAVNMAFGEIPSGVKDGSNLTFTTTNTPSPPGSMMLFVNGVYYTQGADSDYAISGKTITFNTPMQPAPGENFITHYAYQLIGASATLTLLSMNEIPSGVKNGSNTAFVLNYTASPTGSLMVFINGSLQSQGASSDFTVSGKNLYFVTGSEPEPDDNVVTTYSYTV